MWTNVDSFAPDDRNMKDLLTRDTFMEALNNPRLKDKVQEEEPVTIATGTHQCHETHLATAYIRRAEGSANSNNAIK